MQEGILLLQGSSPLGMTAPKRVSSLGTGDHSDCSSLPMGGGSSIFQTGRELGNNSAPSAPFEISTF